MKPIRWPHHALRNVADRETEKGAADRAIKQPQFVVQRQPPQQICIRRYFDPVLNHEMPLRVVVEETQTECVVVTLYKTSQIEKYMKGLEK